MFIHKSLKSAFLAYESKITRLISVMKERFPTNEMSIDETYEALLQDGKTITLDSLNQVFELDNTEKNPIIKLDINCVTEDNSHSIRVGFSGKGDARVRLEVYSDDTAWASITQSVIEEQVERTLKQSWIYKVAGSETQVSFASFGLPIIVLLFGFLIFFAPPPAKLYKSMWLTKADIEELNRTFAKSAKITNEQIVEITKRQITNIKKREGGSLKRLPDFRILSLALPIIVLYGSFVYLIRKCYPTAVFLWGDVEKMYSNIEAKQKLVWSVLIGSMIVGIISSFFVFGLGSFIRS